MAAARLPSLSSPRSVPEHILSLPTAQPLTCPQQGGPDSFKGMMDGSSSVYCTCNNIQQPFCKCGHPALSKLPSVPRFCLKVMFIAWLWLGLVTHNLQFHVKINFNPSSSLQTFIFHSAEYCSPSREVSGYQDTGVDMLTVFCVPS